MKEYSLSWTDTLPETTQTLVQKGHEAFEASQGIQCDYRPFSILMKDGETVVGVLTAYTAFAEIYVDDIWVDPSYRKQGIGRALLKALEDHFEGQGYNNINLVTSQFQAPVFYQKCGFELEFVRKNQKNPQLTKHFFIKYFKNEVQTKGLLTV